MTSPRTMVEMEYGTLSTLSLGNRALGGLYGPYTSGGLKTRF